ncbi:ATP-grasp domain-containing protein [Listeria marthii]|uniref:ATP-grasp domain-containing protein n=2 Tax=Listeriaceae TaxID=186820 RepID=UPI001623CD9C|nr:ATP-grasp domain-containing protein [Listeria marthii]MBC2063146.1 ATP-grasp domain-containing protein [Listeria marthii]MBC2077482.1 ATP-grasp domain-containing protein [Listeria marthii]MBF2490576.1 ATP-grasp domain-containing protein [Listeria marthii]MBF2676009.1 ATP-grasp domain-containing protein [Listeria marthii]
MNIILIGKNRAFIDEFCNMPEMNSVIIIESKKVINNLATYKINLAHKIIYCEYVNNSNFLEEIILHLGNIKIDGVIPGFEYSVPAANELAEYLDLLCVGKKGASIFSNKNKFREFSKEINLKHPRFTKVKSILDLNSFFEGKKIILKPSNRQASIGIYVISSKDELNDAFEDALKVKNEKTVDEDRLEWEYIAEEFLAGYEISSEYLVKDGKMIFNNITYKEGVRDQECIECAHHIPAFQNVEVEKEVHNQINKLIEKANIGTAVLHAEWKVEKKIPVLIECAARMPGDFISNGISSSYNFNFRRAYINLMIGASFKINNLPQRYTIIQFFSAEKIGILSEVKNLNLMIEEQKYNLSYKITKEIGSLVKPPESSWDRLGYFIITSEEYQELLFKKDYLLGNIKFVIN